MSKGARTLVSKVKMEITTTSLVIQYDAPHSLTKRCATCPHQVHDGLEATEAEEDNTTVRLQLSPAEYRGPGRT